MDCNIQPDYNMVSQLALRVALQTMKERCLSLQQRLSVVEEENQSLRTQVESDQRYHDSCQTNKGLSHSNVEVDNLRSQVAELGRQKVQLSDHINMVANENRKLWSRLSQIAKEEKQDIVTNLSKEGKSNASHSTEDDLDSPRVASQNLIRSRTFTQHSPNPNLRLKVINYDNLEKEINDASLEEVLLVEASDDESSNRELKSEDMLGVCETELGFAYLNVHASIDDDFSTEAKKCLEGVHKIRLEAMQQQLDITSTLSTLENRFVLQGCAECAENAQKPEMVDKSLATDESIGETGKYHSHNTENNNSPPSESSGRMDFIQRKIAAGEEDKVCPMCGAIFNSLVTFDGFQNHVESHFLDDALTDPAVEHNFELISHTVGDF